MSDEVKVFHSPAVAFPTPCGERGYHESTLADPGVCRECGMYVVATPELRGVVERAILGMTVYDDESWHCPDENGIPCQFFKDGTRKYS